MFNSKFRSIFQQNLEQKSTINFIYFVKLTLLYKLIQIVWCYIFWRIFLPRQIQCINIVTLHCLTTCVIFMAVSYEPFYKFIAVHLKSETSVCGSSKFCNLCLHTVLSIASVFIIICRDRKIIQLQFFQLLIDRIVIAGSAY